MAKAGQKITTDLFLPDAWTAYTPSWTAATTNPSLGNGSIEGRYISLGPMAWVRGRVVAGSTTTYGSGEYRISLPTSLQSASLIGNGIIGNIWIRNSAGQDFHSFAIDSNTAYFVIRPGHSTFGGTASWSPTTPFTFGNGDWMSWNLSYEVT